jgi:hypothetical protein
MANPLSQKLDWEIANPIWSAALNPIIANPIVQGKVLNNVSLVANVPKILNHDLGRLMQGAFITPFGNATVWVSEPFNNKTITLTASANVVVNIWSY